MSAPIEYSCPYFDDAISEIERARRINSDLREWGEEQEARADEAESRVEELEEFETEAKELRERVETLEEELEESHHLLAQKDARIEELLAILQPSLAFGA